MTEKITDLDSLKSFIGRRTRETWNERSIPYYLSYVASDLKNKNVNYRDFIGAAKLSQWAASTHFSDVKFISHPNVKAKVGFIPADVSFSFEVEKAVETPNPMQSSGHKRGRVLLQFVEALAKLPDESLSNLTIPASVLTALLRA